MNYRKKTLHATALVIIKLYTFLNSDKFVDVHCLTYSLKVKK